MATRPAHARSEEMTMQQLMGMMQGLQEAMAASKAKQERMQADLAASQARNDELHRANEELRRGWHGGDEPEVASPPREFTTPFSQAILETVIPNTFTGPKVTFTGMEDPEAHLTVFHTQILLVGGSDEHSDWDGYGLVHQPPRGSHHVFRPALTTIQRAVFSHQGPSPSFVRPFRRKAISRRDPEGIHKPLWGTGGEGGYHR